MSLLFIFASALLLRQDIRIRDPFVLADAETRTYYLYESKPWYGGAEVSVYTSKDLEHWTPKREVMRCDPKLDVRGTWAPEVTKRNGRYYLAVSLTLPPDPSRPLKMIPADLAWRPGGGPEFVRGQGPCRDPFPRGTWLYEAESPLGPFRALPDQPITPHDWMVIDGTLFESEGKPWMMMAHEYRQQGVGTVDVMPLSDDLRIPLARPKPVWKADVLEKGNHVAEGLYVRPAKAGGLYAIWSGFAAFGKDEDAYVVAVSRSASGRAEGPWTYEGPLFKENGGHAMIFDDFDGTTWIALHQPNDGPLERLRLFELADDGRRLKLGREKPFEVPVRADASPVDAEVRGGWARMMREYYWEPTSLIYSCFPKDVQKAGFYTNGFKVWEKNGDYGYGLEDCAIMGGVALSALCDQYLVTGDKSLKEDARKLARGLVNLATVHGVKGFVARGICVEDGKSVCALSSIDQHTHCLHGLWRYWNSPLFDPALKDDIVRVVSEVADRMTAQVTEENDWSFQQAVGNGTTRGICKMRFNLPHEGARLAMFYAVAWDISRKEEYRALWRRHVDEGLSNSMRLATQDLDSIARGYSRWLMDYALLQMQTSLEVLLALAPTEGERKWVRAAMLRPAEIARVRAGRIGTGNGPYLCSCAELSLAQTMVPDFPYDEEQEKILRDSIAAEPFADKAPSMRVVHLAAAWWRWRLRTKSGK